MPAKAKVPPPDAGLMAANFDRVAGLARMAGLPEVAVGTNHGTPALRVRDKSFVRMKDKGTLVLLCPLEQKEFLMEVAPAIYFETDHYKGWPAVLVRLHEIGDEELAARLEDSGGPRRRSVSPKPAPLNRSCKVGCG